MEIPDVHTTCSTCGGDGLVEGSLCTTCMGGGSDPPEGRLLMDKLILEMLSELPTKTQMLQKFTDLQSDVENIKTGIQAIWNKVKDL